MPIAGSAGRTILPAGRQAEASLVVLGIGQGRGIERLILGSTAEYVAAHSDRDVLVLPAEPGKSRAAAMVHEMEAGLALRCA